LEDINQLLRGKVLRGIYSRIYNAWIWFIGRSFIE
jgi:hypothetical protein